jgi:hypothetical protein
VVSPCDICLQERNKHNLGSKVVCYSDLPLQPSGGQPKLNKVQLVVASTKKLNDFHIIRVNLCLMDILVYLAPERLHHTNKHTEI